MGNIANLFGYALNFLYDTFNNYGIAIIIFSILIKIILLPMSIKQQKTMVKSSKVQAKLKEIQDKYKNDQTKLTEETLNLYKEEKMSPFSGCLGAIVQIVILFAMFYLVSKPLTHMRKIDLSVIEKYNQEIAEEGKSTTTYQEIAIIKEKGINEEGNETEVYINMDFVGGLSLTSVPKEESGNYKVYIIPVLYVISSIISMQITTRMQKKNMKNNENNKEMETLNSMNKSMLYVTPIMSVMISMIAPLGLGLYWLVNNVLMIVERIIINVVFIKKEEDVNG